jgi:hypothetical protein
VNVTDQPEPRRIKLPPGSVPPPDAAEGPRMLPGMAMIAIFMLFYALLNVFAAWRGAYGQGIVRTVALCICTLFVVGVFGFLRLRRWGWALMTGGAFFLSLYDVVQFVRSHVGIARGGAVLIQAAFAMIFFLYLVRTEIRERVH